MGPSPVFVSSNLTAPTNTRGIMYRSLDVLFKEWYPEQYKRMKKYNCWTYSIYSPMSMDDPAEIIISIQWSKNNPERERLVIEL